MGEVAVFKLKAAFAEVVQDTKLSFAVGLEEVERTSIAPYIEFCVVLFFYTCVTEHVQSCFCAK